jgi:hypothetical protein
MPDRRSNSPPCRKERDKDGAAPQKNMRVPRPCLSVLWRDRVGVLTSFDIIVDSERPGQPPISRMGRFAELRGELRWQLLFNGAKDGKPQCTIFAVFEVKRKFWINCK